MKQVSRHKNRHKRIFSTIKSTLRRHRWLVILPLFIFISLGTISTSLSMPVSAGTADACERNPATCGGSAPAPIHPTVSAPKKAAFHAFIKCVSMYSGMAMVDYDANPFVQQGRIDPGNMAANKWWLSGDDWARGVFGSWGPATWTFAAITDLVTGNVGLTVSGPVKAVSAGSYLLSSTPQDSGNTSCNDILKAGLELWGYGSSMEILDKAGVKRANNSDSTSSGSGSWGEISSKAGAIKTSLAPRIYGGNTSYTSEERYVIYRAAWLRGCTSDGQIVKAASSTANNYKYPDLQYIDDNKAGQIDADTYVGLDRGTVRWVYVNDDGRIIALNCAQIADKMKEYSKPYSDWLQANQNSESMEQVCDRDPSAEGCENIVTGSQPTCGSIVDGIGWFICPVINALSGFNDAMWGLASTLLRTAPLEEGSVAHTVWQSFRNLANVILVIFFLIIIISQLTNFGVSNYGIKKALPRLVIIAIAINLSFIIIQFATDAANIIGASIYNFLNGVADTANSPKSWLALINLITGAAAGTLAVTGAVVLAGGPAAAFYLILPAAALAALGFLAAIATLIFRQAIIPILAILAPLAFVAYLLPNTEQWFKKWKDLFLSMLILYITAALLFGGVKLASNMIIDDGSDWWRLLIGLIMMGVPLFTLPFIARQGGPLAGGLMKGMQGGIQKLRKPLEGYANPRADRARANYANGAAAATGRLSGLRKLYAKRRMAQMRVQDDAKAANTEFENQYRATEAGKARLDRIGKADQQQAIDKALSGTRIEGDVDLQLRARTANLELDAAKKKTEQLVQELGTEATAAEAPHLAAVDSGIRSRIQTAQQSIDVAKDATASAERRQRSEYAEALKTSAGVAGGLAQQAGGVAKNGESLAVARAIEQEKRTRAENVSAAGVLMTTEQYSNSDYLSVLAGTLKSGAPASVEQQEAAVNAIHASGSVGDKIRAGAQLAQMAAANPGNEEVISLQQAYEKLGGLPQYVSGRRRDEYRQGIMTATIPDLIVETANDGKVSPQMVGKMDVDEMKEYVKALSDPTTRARISPQRQVEMAQAIEDARKDDVIGKIFGPRELEQLDQIQSILTGP